MTQPTETAMSQSPLPRPSITAEQFRAPPALSRKAVAALILGGLTLVLPIVAAIPAILLAIRALKEISARQGQLTGKGFAITGLVLGVICNLSILPMLQIYHNLTASAPGAVAIAPQWETRLPGKLVPFAQQAPPPFGKREEQDDPPPKEAEEKNTSPTLRIIVVSFGAEKVQEGRKPGDA
jgi:hypothetical protein